MLMCVKDLNKKGAGPSGVRMHSAYLPFLRTLSVTLSLSSLFLGQFRTNIYNFWETCPGSSYDGCSYLWSSHAYKSDSSPTGTIPVNPGSVSGSKTFKIKVANFITVWLLQLYIRFSWTVCHKRARIGLATINPPITFEVCVHPL